MSHSFIGSFHDIISELEVPIASEIETMKKSLADACTGIETAAKGDRSLHPSEDKICIEARRAALFAEEYFGEIGVHKVRDCVIAISKEAEYLSLFHQACGFAISSVGYTTER